MQNLSLTSQFILIAVLNFLFIYFRTLNVSANADRNRLVLFYTGFLVHVSWLLSTALGVQALQQGNYMLVVASAAGGLYGADCAITGKFKKQKHATK